MLDHGEPIDVHGWESVYLVCLSLTIEGLALLAFGLVRPWGERAPRWLPVIGGRRVPPRTVIAAAATGTVLVTFIALMFFVPSDSIADLEATDAGRAVAVACYLPLLLWGPMLGALTIAYRRRRLPRLTTTPPNVPPTDPPCGTASDALDVPRELGVGG